MTEASRLKKNRMLAPSSLLQDLYKAKKIFQQKHMSPACSSESEGAPYGIGHRKMEKAMLSIRQCFYEGDNKAGTLLANRLTVKNVCFAIFSLRDRKGKVSYHPESIAKIFADCFALLYRDVHSSQLANLHLLQNSAGKYLSECGMLC